MRLWVAHLSVHLSISKILNDVTNTFFADWKTECWLSSCDALNHANDGFSMLQHFSANSYDRMAWVRQIRDLCFSCFGSRRHFHPVTNSASVNRSTSINIEDVCGCFWLTLSSKELYHSMVFVAHIIDWLHWGSLLQCQKSTLYLNAGNFKFVLSEITFLALLLAKKNNMGQCFFGQPAYLLHRPEAFGVLHS